MNDRTAFGHSPSQRGLLQLHAAAPRCRHAATFVAWIASFVACVPGGCIQAQDAAKDTDREANRDADTKVAEDLAAARADQFRLAISPFLNKYCARCHDESVTKSGVRIDRLGPDPDEPQLRVWKGVLRQLEEGSMPPADEAQPDPSEREQAVHWIENTLDHARRKDRSRNGAARRLTVAQYRNTLRDLLALDEDLTDSLPPDALSRDGFTNNSQSMILSPLQAESYFQIVEQAIDRSLVDPASRPHIQCFRMELGTAINPTPCPEALVLGANSDLLNNADFVVTEPRPAKPFDFESVRMRTAYDFIEGYAGNDTVRGWRKYDSIYHVVFACMRGTPGYPKGEAFRVLPNGLALRPAIPSPEIFGQSNTYGPMANFKISLRQLPGEGDFQVRVRAARYDDGLLLEPGASTTSSPDAIVVARDDPAGFSNTTFEIPADGIYQVDMHFAPGNAPGLLAFRLGGRVFAGQPAAKPLAEGGTPSADPLLAAAFLLVRLGKGEQPLQFLQGEQARIRRFVFQRLDPASSLARRFEAFERRVPSLGAYLGLRRDCGSTMTRIGTPQRVNGSDLREYVFQGSIRDFPGPDVEPDNVNYLAGIHEIGIRSEYTDGRDMPRLMIRSVEFEGPYFREWPPESHRRIFLESPHAAEPTTYAREILESFATRAFRRPVTADELDRLLAVQSQSLAEQGDFQRSIKDALLVVLTSPQFLFLIEDSVTPQPEELSPFELASKLSYFLWNSMPDDELLKQAGSGTLSGQLDTQIDRMMRDARFEQGMREFVTQWLSLDKLNVLAVDIQKFPKLTRDVKTQLLEEPVKFVSYLLRHNRPLRQLIDADFTLANEVVAGYYNLGDHCESGFDFVPLTHQGPGLGGILAQAGVLAGLSDGRHSNPIKRGAWFARKIIAEPPADPPPNVPQLRDDPGGMLSLREKLELHRNQPGCAKCHSGIDPWGLPFEDFDAGGLLRNPGVPPIPSTLPDGTVVNGWNELRDYLIGKRQDRIAFSFLKHLATYAVGRELSFHELELLESAIAELRASDYRAADLLRFIVHSDIFLKK